MFDLKLLSPQEVKSIMSKMNRSIASFDEFCYEEDLVFCHCGVRASRRISHTAQNPNRKFFGCSNYKSKGDKGCSYFEWFDEKVAAVTEKLKMANLVESLRSQVYDLRVQNMELQAELDRLDIKASPDDSESSSCNIHFNADHYDMKNELEALKRRVERLERRSY
ncbi:hypothetical protein LINGRAHAP2_LOCUS30670 [Linum grandiflorum]